MSFLKRLFQTIVTGGSGDGSTVSLDSLLAHFDKELANFQTLIQPTPESKPRTTFDSDLPREQISMANLTLPQMLSMLPIMLPLRRGMGRSAQLYDGHFQPTRSRAPQSFFNELEAIAREAGASEVKYVKVPHYAIFRHMGIPHEFAILITVEMDEANIATAPSFEAMREVVKGYKNLALISNKMAHYMREQGFAAYPGTAVGGLTDYCHLAEAAGLGAIGYHGLLVTPKEGARLRINTIYTNITNLPLETKNEHLWIRDFCDMCKKCIRECPPKAIFEQPRPRGDGGMQCIDHGACRDYFQANYGCAICVALCPFSRAGYEKIKTHFKGNVAAPRFRIPSTVAVV